jgi:hypothetical protein
VVYNFIFILWHKKKIKKKEKRRRRENRGLTALAN